MTGNMLLERGPFTFLMYTAEGFSPPLFHTDGEREKVREASHLFWRAHDVCRICTRCVVCVCIL